MHPAVGRGALQLALFIILLALGLLLIVPRDTPAFVVTILSLGVGCLFLLLVIVLIRVLRR